MKKWQEILLGAAVSLGTGFALYKLTRPLGSRAAPGDHVFTSVINGSVQAPGGTRFVVEVESGNAGKLLAVQGEQDNAEVAAAASAALGQIQRLLGPLAQVVTFRPEDVTRIERPTAQGPIPLRGSV